MKNYLFKILLPALFALCFQNTLLAQRHTLSGYIRDVKSGETLIGATVYVPTLAIGTTTNNYGFYSLTLPADTHLVLYSYIGYEQQVKQIDLFRDISLNVNLGSGDLELQEIIISDVRSRARENVERPQMGVIDIPIATIKELPAVFGEKDLLKSIQLLPGVQSGSEATAGFYVRGGGPDQNLIMLDEAVVYNPYHLAGFLSVFNLDAIRDVTLHKGGFPAQYGGRLSSILDIKMKEGNNRTFHGEGGIGLITSRLTFEGPIVKERASFMVSGRAFYLPYIIRGLTPRELRSTLPSYTFYDLNAKVNYQFSDKDRIYVSGYFGEDVITLNPSDTFSFNIPWGNKTFTFRWNHLFGPKLFANTTLVYNDYLFQFQNKVGAVDYRLISGIKDQNAKIDFDYFPSVRHRVKFGASYTYHTFIPSTVRGSVGEVNFENVQQRFVHQGAVYLGDEVSVTDRFSLNAGLRVPLFIYRDISYSGVEPRFTFKYGLDRNTSVKAGYTRMNQYVHLLTNSTATTPMDLWIPSSHIVRPQISDQVAAGIFHNFLDDRYEANIEVYYKDMRNQIEYREGSNVFFNTEIDEILVFGKGWSYGSEFFIQKKDGRLHGWVGYTLSWTKRRFPDLNQNQTYPAKYDRRHDLSMVFSYDINEKWAFAGVFVYGSGHSITLPQGRFFVPVDGWVNSDTYYSDYEGKNAFKLRSYNRLDLGIKRTGKIGRFVSELRMDIYNVYSRRNPYFVYLTTDLDPHSNSAKYVAKQVSLLPMIPSLSYNFRF